jgi:hypothetical protein
VRTGAATGFGAALALLLAGAAHAFDESGDGERIGAPERPDDRVAFKFTPTYYWTTNEPTAYDLNLRGSRGANTAWVGFYRQHEDFQQLRGGYERTVELPFGKIVLGGQIASRGFLGGAIGAQIGGPVFALLGFGRTNLKPYFNLNFDPNDAVLFGGGAQLGNTLIQAFQVLDDRTGTGQRVTHYVVRTRADARNRWSLDIFHRAGWSAPTDGVPISATGIGLTWDHEPWFIRVTWDPNVNFTPDNMLRAAVGVRF